MNTLSPTLLFSESVQLFTCDAKPVNKNVSKLCQFCEARDERGEGGERGASVARKGGEARCGQQEAFHSGGGGQHWLRQVHLPAALSAVELPGGVGAGASRQLEGLEGAQLAAADVRAA